MSILSYLPYVIMCYIIVFPVYNFRKTILEELSETRLEVNYKLKLLCPIISPMTFYKETGIVLKPLLYTHIVGILFYFIWLIQAQFFYQSVLINNIFISGILLFTLILLVIARIYYYKLAFIFQASNYLKIIGLAFPSIGYAILTSVAITTIKENNDDIKGIFESKEYSTL